MTYGLDTGFLVAAEVGEHPDYACARDCLELLVARSHTFAIAPQVLSEFIHIVTDPRRFGRHLESIEAREVASWWWNAPEVRHVFPNSAATLQFLAWLEQYSIGRKRLLDTLLAATYQAAGVRSILTTNSADFTVFGVFNCVTPRQADLLLID